MADGRVVFAAPDQRHLVPVDLRLPLPGRPLLGVDGDARGLGVDLPGFDTTGDVPDVVVVSIGRGFARERVLGAKLSVGRIGEPPEHRGPVWVIRAFADRAQAFAIRDLETDVLGKGAAERGGAGHNRLSPFSCCRLHAKP